MKIRKIFENSCIKFVNNDKRMNYLVFDQNYDRLR